MYQWEEGSLYDLYLTPQHNETLRVRVCGAEKVLKSSGILYYLPYLVFALLFWWADPFPGSALLSLLILGMGVWGGGQDLVYQKKLLLLLREELGLPL